MQANVSKAGQLLQVIERDKRDRNREKKRLRDLTITRTEKDNARMTWNDNREREIMGNLSLDNCLPLQGDGKAHAFFVQEEEKKIKAVRERMVKKKTELQALKNEEFTEQPPVSSLIKSNVSDPSHFDVDPDPGIHIWEKWIRILGSTSP